MTDQSQPLDDAEMSAVTVEVNWDVQSSYRAQMTLLDLLQGLDMNEEEWRNEDGSCRFTSVEEALTWARKDGLSSYWAEDMLGQLATERNVDDVDVDTFGAVIRLSA